MTEHAEKVTTEELPSNSNAAADAAPLEEQGDVTETPKEEMGMTELEARVSDVDDVDEEEEDAAALMEAALAGFKRPADFEVGDKIEGSVVSIDSQYVFLDIGSTSEASLPKESLLSRDIDIPEVGTKLEAFVINISGGAVELGMSMPGGDDSMAAIEDAFEKQIPVEGFVRGRNKGGLEVDVFGKRAFCPISQIELRFCEDLDVHLSQTYTFRIIELREGGKNIVVSRRVLLEEEQKKYAVEIREKLEVGAEFIGTVTSLTNYGAFVDLGHGVEGLVHVSEISHQRVQDPADVLATGQQVRVQVQKYIPEKDRISLSMKALEQDPWDLATSQFKTGDIVRGKVVRLQQFGAFVEIAPGVDGLIHISELSHRRVAHPKEVVNAGDVVEVKVINIDLDKKRIGLSLKELDATGAPPPIDGNIEEGLILDVVVDKVEGFGVFVRLPQNKRGLIPNGELNLPKGADASKAYAVDSTIKALITRIDENGRIRLSERAITKKREQDEFKEYKQSNKKKEEPVFGTLGDLLKKFQK